MGLSGAPRLDPPFGALPSHLPAAGVLAAVDMQDLTGDEARTFEVEDGIDDVADLAHPANRVQRRQGRVRLLRMHGGLDDPPRTPVLANSMASDWVTAFNPPLVSDARAAGTPAIG